MATRQPRYSREEFSRRGQEIYDRVVRPALRPEDENKFVAIDIESGSYEMDADDYAAVALLLKRVPDAQPRLIRVGRKAPYRIRALSDLRSASCAPAEQLADSCRSRQSDERPCELNERTRKGLIDSV